MEKWASSHWGESVAANGTRQRSRWRIPRGIWTVQRNIFCVFFIIIVCVPGRSLSTLSHMHKWIQMALVESAKLRNNSANQSGRPHRPGERTKISCTQTCAPGGTGTSTVYICSTPVLLCRFLKTKLIIGSMNPMSQLVMTVLTSNFIFWALNKNSGHHCVCAVPYFDELKRSALFPVYSPGSLPEFLSVLERAENLTERAPSCHSVRRLLREYIRADYNKGDRERPGGSP